jgi:cyclin-dependent kinase 8/11
MFHGYQLVGEIGKGTYGQVFKACKGRELSHAPWYEVVPPYFAVKRQIVKDESSSSQQPGAGVGAGQGNKEQKKEGEDTAFSVSLLREVKLLRELHHPNIVNMCDLIFDPKTYELALVFEYAEYEMMKVIEYYKNDLKDSIPEYTVKSFMWQSLKGLKFLHENWIMHRDLKPENILIVGGDGKRRGSVVLADLGLARIFRNPVLPIGYVDKVVVTLWYRAPELLLGATNYTPAIDMWSMGCIFASLLLAKDPNLKALFQGRQIEKEEVISGTDSKRPPFQTDQCDKIFRVLGLPKSNTWPGVDALPDFPRIQKDRNYPRQSVLRSHFRDLKENHPALNLLTKMLEMNPADRISAADALKHPYFCTDQPLPGDNAIDIPGPTVTRLKFPIEPPKPLDLSKAEAQQRDIERKREEVKRRYDHEETKRSKLASYGDL